MEAQHRESRQLRYDQASRTVFGTVVPVGGVALVNIDGQTMRETINPGAMSWDDSVTLNLQHLREHVVSQDVQLEETPTGLELRASLSGPDADIAIRGLERGSLRGLSSEFYDVDVQVDGDLREVRSAVLTGVALVDSAAYPGATVQLRRGGRYRSRISSRRRLPCKCVGPSCKSVRYRPGSFKGAVDGDDEVLLLVGQGFSSAIASKRRGSLLLSESTDGDLVADFELPPTPATDDLVERSLSTDIVMRPIVDDDNSDFTDIGDVREYASVKLRALLLRPTEDPDGWHRLDGTEVTSPRNRAKEALRWL